MRAALAVAYATGQPDPIPAIDEMLTIAPPPPADIQGTTFHVARTEAMRSTERLTFHPASSSLNPKPLALFTRMSTLPRAFLAASRKPSRALACPASHGPAYT